jgi:hypothetical protein
MGADISFVGIALAGLADELAVAIECIVQKPQPRLRALREQQLVGTPQAVKAMRVGRIELVRIRLWLATIPYSPKMLGYLAVPANPQSHARPGVFSWGGKGRLEGEE